MPPFTALAGFILITIVQYHGCGVADHVKSTPQVGNVSVDARRVRGIVAVSFELSDPEGHVIQVKVDYRLDGENWKPASSAPGAGKGTGFVAGKTPKPQVFLWDSMADERDTASLCLIRVTAINPSNRASAESTAFYLANDNIAPRARFSSIGDSKSGHVPFTIDIEDNEGEPLCLDFAFSVDGGTTYSPARLLEPTCNYVTDSTPEEDNDLNVESYALHWDASNDLDWASRSAVRLKLTPVDELGGGEAALSWVFSVDFSLPPNVTLYELPSTLRKLVPIVFSVTGMPGPKYRASFGYTFDGGETIAPLTQKIMNTDATINLSASPEGDDHSFLWDSEKDFEEPVVRGFELTVTLLDWEGEPLDPSPNDKTPKMSVNNAEIASYPLISEIYSGDYDPETGRSNNFIEITTDTGWEFFDYYLTLIDRFGVRQIEVYLGGLTVGESGVFVIGGPELDEADHIFDDIGAFFDYATIPLPHIIVLETGDAENRNVIEALGYGDFTGYRDDEVEKAPAPVPPEGKSLSRDFGNTDSNNNALDFIISDPTPGLAPLFSE